MSAADLVGAPAPADATIDRPRFGAVTAVGLSGATYRQLDYWARIELVVPSVAANGSGTARRYSFRDLLMLDITARFSAWRIGDTAIARHVCDIIRATPASELRGLVVRIGEPAPIVFEVRVEPILVALTRRWDDLT